MKINQNIARSLPIAMQLMFLGADGTMDLQKNLLKQKVNKKIRALPGTDNAYKAQLRKDKSTAERRLTSLIKAAGAETYEQALANIKRNRQRG